MRKLAVAAGAAVSLLAAGAAVPAAAWDRGHAEIFAVLPAGSTGPEGLTVGPDGNVYVTTFGFNNHTAVAGPGQLFVFRPDGRLIRQVSIVGTSSHLLGLAFPPGPSTRTVLVIDFGSGNVRAVNPVTGASSVFITVPNPAASGLNALTFDRAGNVYVSDSFQATIWRTGPAGGMATSWVTDPTLGTDGVPPFGANGIEFNNAGTAMLVANTGNDTLVTVPVISGGNAGKPAVLTNSINGADGIVIDRHDNIWTCANQADEIVVVDPTGKAIAKLGDFDGIDRDGVPHGFFFPASPAFSLDGKTLFVSDLALDIRLAGVPTQAVDSQWADEVQLYTVSKIPARIPPFPADGNDD